MPRTTSTFTSFVSTLLWLGGTTSFSVTLPGQAQTLSAGNPAPLNYLNLQLFNAGTGSSAQGQAGGIRPFNDLANMGNLSSVGNDAPAQAVLGLRVDGGLGYTLTMARQNFVATNLQYQGRPIGQSDGGSFIRVTAGVIRDRTAVQNAVQLNPALLGEGLTLDQISSGVVNPASTLVLFSNDPTSSGTPVGAAASTIKMNKPTALGSSEVPLFFSVPTGLCMGPINPRSRGVFSATLQFSVFAKP